MQFLHYFLFHPAGSQREVYRDFQPIFKCHFSNCFSSSLKTHKYCQCRRLWAKSDLVFFYKIRRFGHFNIWAFWCVFVLVFFILLVRRLHLFLEFPCRRRSMLSPVPSSSSSSSTPVPHPGNCFYINEVRSSKYCLRLWFVRAIPIQAWVPLLLALVLVLTPHPVFHSSMWPPRNSPAVFLVSWYCAARSCRKGVWDHSLGQYYDHGTECCVSFLLHICS